MDLIPILINLDKKTSASKNGILIPIEDYQLKMDIKRIFFIYGFDEDISKNERAAHGHYDSLEYLIAINGSFDVIIEDMNGKIYTFNLDSRDKALFIPKRHFLLIKNITQNAIVLAICNNNLDESDIYTK